MKILKRKSGISSAELLVAIGIVSLLALLASKAQVFTISSIVKAEFGSVMDQYQMETLTKVQSSTGLQTIKSWINTNNIPLRNCLERNGVNCPTLHNTRIALNSAVVELSARRFNNAGSICVGADCDGESRIWLVPECEAPNICSGVNVSVETANLKQPASSPRRVALFFSALKLVPSVGLDFSCTSGGNTIYGFDLANRKALCHSANVVNCAGAVPNELSGVGTISPNICKPIITFASRDKDGLGNNTTLFSPGYKSIGLSQPITPGTITNALAQEECGITILRKVVMRVGDTYKGTGTCPGNSQKVLYHPTHQRVQTGPLEGSKIPYDPTPENATWGKSKGTYYDYRFASPTMGYSNVEWHFWERCCRDREDVWTLDQIADTFREEIDIDASNNTMVKRELIAIMDSDPITVTFNILDQGRNLLMSKSVTTTETGGHRILLPIVEVPSLEVVSGSTPIGVTSLTSNGTHIFMTRVEEVQFSTAQNSATYTYNLLTNSFVSTEYSNNVSPSVTVKFNDGHGNILATESRTSPEAKYLSRLQGKLVGVHDVQVVPASTPTSVESYEVQGNRIVMVSVKDAFLNPTPGPAQNSTINLNDSNGNLLKTVNLVVSPDAKLRVKYIMDFDWTLTDAANTPVDFQVKNKEGVLLRSIEVPPGHRVKVTYKKNVQIVPR